MDKGLAFADAECQPIPFKNRRKSMFKIANFQKNRNVKILDQQGAFKVRNCSKITA